jgi:hypothetical protein
MSKTMLLTKRLTTFLSQSTTPQLQTLILLSPTGKLLCSSSPSPACTLRTQATLACSLWNLYHPFNTNASSLVSSSLPQSPTGAEAGNAKTGEKDLSCITIQLEYGIMCIRMLSSGLLFVAIGPSNTFPSQFQYPQHLSVSRNISSTYTSPPSSPTPHEADGHGGLAALHAEGTISGAASDVGSVGTDRGANASIWGIRKKAAEVSQLLEGRLEGFRLGSGDWR